MIPRNINPRQLKKMMKQLGIKSEDIDNVEEIIIKTPTKDYIFKDAHVTMVEAQGQKTFQVVGEPTIVEKDKEGGGPVIPEEDIMLVAEKAGVSEEDAKKALVECNGEPAEAIIKLMSK